MSSIITDIAGIFNYTFTKSDLQKGQFKQAVEFVKAHRGFLEAEGVRSAYLNIADYRKVNKEEMCILSGVPYFNQNTYDQYRKFLPANLATVLDALIWEHRLKHKEIKEKFGINIIATQKKQNVNFSYEEVSLKPDFHFFNYQSIKESPFSFRIASYNLFLDPGLREILSQYYEKPTFAQLIPVPNRQETQFIYERGNVFILADIPKLIGYYAKGQIKTTSSGRPAKTAIPKMQRALGLQEFFPPDSDKVLRNVRTTLLVGLLVHRKVRNLPVDPEKILKHHFFQKAFQDLFRITPSILYYFKGISSVEKYAYRDVEPSILKLINLLPVGQWIHMDNLIQYLKFNFIELDPIQKGYAREHLYFELASDNISISDFSQRVYIDEQNRMEYLQIPFIKGVFFFLAAYGLVDIAYNEVEMEKMGVDVFSPYDGLKYIRLNRLGGFVIGKEETFELPDVFTNSTVKLSEASLTILVDPDDEIAPSLISPFSKQVSATRYQTDASFFLKEVQSSEDLEHKIQLFQQCVRHEIPDNWKIFFEALRRKIDPITVVETYKTFQISPDDVQLKRLMVRDEVLKAIILKAEDYHILVHQKHLNKFKNRLKGYGYLISI